MDNNTKIIYLSYFLSEDTPLYGNGKGIIINQDKLIESGDSCNTTNLSFPNHSGTHIDFPIHFNPEGKKLNDYPASFWQFDKIEIVDLSYKIKDCQILEPELFIDIDNREAELLLIKTGYGNLRGSDQYTITPPGLSSKLAPFFRNNYPHLRCLGMDLISISSFSNRDEGRQAHHAFLNPEIGEPITEDQI